MKILIIGSVGSGKTTLARKMSEKLNIKYYEMDSIVHDDIKKIKRKMEEQIAIIEEIDKNPNWIIEGTLRKNLYFLLDKVDIIIYLDIPKNIRKRNIIIRFLKQKLNIENCNYNPSIKMLKNMFKWTKQFELEKKSFENNLTKYHKKIIILRSKKEIEKYFNDSYNLFDKIQTEEKNMINYEDLYNEVKEILSEKRFKHSEGVVKRALEYADIYNVDKEKLKLVAIAHDIAKEFSEEENQKYIREYNIELDEVENQNNNLLHAKVGAYICKNKYNFTDDMVNAVRFHTTGRESMSMLEKIIYLADATEDSRSYNKEPYVNIIKENIDIGMCEVCKWVINHLMERKSVIHLDTIKCYNYYTKKNEIGGCYGYQKRNIFNLG